MDLFLTPGFMQYSSVYASLCVCVCVSVCIFVRVSEIGKSASVLYITDGSVNCFRRNGNLGTCSGLNGLGPV